MVKELLAAGVKELSESRPSKMISASPPKIITPNHVN
jgi:hypothetical protein